MVAEQLHHDIKRPIFDASLGKFILLVVLNQTLYANTLHKNKLLEVILFREFNAIIGVDIRVGWLGKWKIGSNN